MCCIILNSLSCPFTDSIVSKPRISCLPASFFAPAFSKLMCWLGVEYHVDHLIFSPGSPSSFVIQPCHPQEAHPFWSPASLSLYQSWSVFVGLHRVQVHIHSCILHACIWLHPEAFGLRDKTWTYNIMNKGWQPRNGFLINCNQDDIQYSVHFMQVHDFVPFSPETPTLSSQPPTENPYEKSLWMNIHSKEVPVSPSSQVARCPDKPSMWIRNSDLNRLEAWTNGSNGPMVASTRRGERALLATLRHVEDGTSRSRLGHRHRHHHHHHHHHHESLWIMNHESCMLHNNDKSIWPNCTNLEFSEIREFPFINF